MSIDSIESKKILIYCFYVAHLKKYCFHFATEWKGNKIIFKKKTKFGMFKTHNTHVNCFDMERQAVCDFFFLVRICLSKPQFVTQGNVLSHDLCIAVVLKSTHQAFIEILDVQFFFQSSLYAICRACTHIRWYGSVKYYNRFLLAGLLKDIVECDNAWLKPYCSWNTAATWI